MRSIILAVLVLAWGSASAEVIYTYTGSPYTSFSNSLLDGYTGESIDIETYTQNELNLYDTGMHVTVELVFEKELDANAGIILESAGPSYDRHFSSQVYNRDNRLVSYTFSDGVDTIYKTGDQMDGGYSGEWELSFLNLHTDENGDIRYWGLEAESSLCNTSITFCFSVATSWGPDPVDYNTENMGDHAGYYQAIGDGDVNSDDLFFRNADTLQYPSGTWSSSVVPIPAAVWLFGSALAGLGWLRRKQTV